MGNPGSFRREVKEFLDMAAAMLRGDYPAFVVKNRRDTGLPVFTYHKADPDILSAHLEYLRENGYQTLNVLEFMRLAKKGDESFEKKVMLTFDDGWDDLYTVAYPLLKSHGLQGVAFISPYWLGTAGVVTWQQVEKMHASGVLDIQSHTFSHGRIPVSSRVIDFYHPGMKGKWDAHLPFISGHVPAPPDRLSVPLGFPMYEHDSGLSDRRRFLGDPDYEARCIETVEREGGESFFSKDGWRSRLLKRVKKNGRIPMRFESPEDQERRIRDELVRAKRELEDRLEGKQVIALAYPYHIQGRMAARLLRESGHPIVFGGVLPDCGFGDPSGGHRYVKRVNADFIPRLPGRGRTALSSLLWMKLSRRAKGQ